MKILGDIFLCGLLLFMFSCTDNQVNEKVLMEQRIDSLNRADSIIENELLQLFRPLDSLVRLEEFKNDTNRHFYNVSFGIIFRTTEFKKNIDTIINISNNLTESDTKQINEQVNVIVQLLKEHTRYVSESSSWDIQVQQSVLDSIQQLTEPILGDLLNNSMINEFEYNLSRLKVAIQQMQKIAVRIIVFNWETKMPLLITQTTDDRSVTTTWELDSSKLENWKKNR